jgi:VanZ family protein
MCKKMKKFLPGLLPWVPVLLWMALIFFLSSKSGAESGSMSGGFIEKAAAFLIPGFSEQTQAQREAVIDRLQYVTRKAGHIAEYAILGALVTSALLQLRLTMRKRFPAAVGIGIVYAVTDEVHQLFVPGRSGSAFDLLFDGLGIFLGVLAVLGIYSAHKKRKKRRTGQRAVKVHRNR